MKFEIIRNYYIFLLGKFVFSGFIILEDKTIETFLTKLKNQGVDINLIERDYFWNYIVYQIKYWVEKKTRFNGKIYVSWVFGDKAIKRWLSKNENYLYFSEQFLREYDIKRPIQYYAFKVDLQKKRELYSSSEEGYLLCIEEDLFSLKSSICKKCKYLNICKIIG